MTGAYPKRIVFFIWYFTVRPRDAFRWLYFLISKNKVIDACVPWMTWRAIDFFNKNIKQGMKIFEYGAGGSTLFFLKKGCLVTSIENSKEWKELVERKAYYLSLAHNLNLRFFPANRQDQEILLRYIQSVNDGGPWDVIIVDGIPEVRIECIHEAIKNITPTGMLVLDDANWERFKKVPVILRDWKRLKFIGLGPERRGVSETDIYFKTL
ncbi:MAG: hypothetical protein QW279_08630 [Candidatus Jordarchaeaceae archaeon]